MFLSLLRDRERCCRDEEQDVPVSACVLSVRSLLLNPTLFFHSILREIGNTTIANREFYLKGSLLRLQIATLIAFRKGRRHD